MLSRRLNVKTNVTPSGSGSTWDYLDLVYQHGDGRRQFCSGVNSWTYDVQNGKQHPNSALECGVW